MSGINPPSPIWEHRGSGLSVWVNGSTIEVCGNEFTRCLPDEVADLGAQLTAAIAEATRWADRWNKHTREYFLTDSQRAGHVCTHCGDAFEIGETSVPVGVVGGAQVFAHDTCAEVAA